jgi:hypothetical protein
MLDTEFFPTHNQVPNDKLGRNEPADVTNNIAALSRIVLQVFAHSDHGSQFHSIPEVTALLQVHQHILLMPMSFLILLNTQPLKVNNSEFQLSPVDMASVRRSSLQD